jgi:death on curing protein
MQELSLEAVQYIAHSLAKEMLGFDEPIPDFGTRYPNILESCLALPFQTFDKKSLYTTFSDKAAILFYLMIKNHPFQNGNKRVAVTTLLVFLAINKKWIKADVKSLYQFAVDIAKSDPKQKSKIYEYIKIFIETHIEPY